MVLGGLAAAAVGIHLHCAVLGQAGDVRRRRAGRRRLDRRRGRAARLPRRERDHQHAAARTTSPSRSSITSSRARCAIRPASTSRRRSPIGDDNMLGNLPGLDVHWGLGFGLIACFAGLVPDAADDVRVFSAHGGGQHPRRAAQRASGAAFDRDRHVPGRPGRRAGRRGRGGGHSRQRQRLAGHRLWLHGRARRVHRPRQSRWASSPSRCCSAGSAPAAASCSACSSCPTPTVNVLQGVIFIAILFSDSLYGATLGAGSGRAVAA